MIVGTIIASAVGQSEPALVDTGAAVERPSKADRLVDRHDCWTDTAPAGVEIPGHVVVTTSEGRTVYGGERLVGLALDQIFAGDAHGLHVAGFCR